MESLTFSHLFPSVQATSPTRQRCPYVKLEGLSGVTFFSRSMEKHLRYYHIICRSKRSMYQEFQDFAKPFQLLPAKQVTTYSILSCEEITSSLELDKSTAFYMVELCTSKDFGSCLRDLNAAIMICLIDGNGRSILQRLSTISEEKNMKTSECIHFQRGSVDTSTFKGPKLENIAALWIGLESGSWRVDGVGLKVINGPMPTSSSAGVNQGDFFSGMQYKFEANNILLGDGGLSVIELRPTLVTKLSSLNSLSKIPSSNPALSKEGSMEYATLKFSLLLYDFILVITGTTVLAVFSPEMNFHGSFLAGGIGGFLYLLLLQRSVDGLSAPVSSSSASSSSGEDEEVEMSLPGYGGLKQAVLILVSLIFATAVSANYWMDGQSAVFSSSQIFTGVAGFLTCKIAVVLAAFKPIQMSFRKNRTLKQEQGREDNSEKAMGSRNDLLGEDDDEAMSN